MVVQAITAHQHRSSIKPLLTHGAIERTGDHRIPGNYCRERHVWIAEGGPIVKTRSTLAELTTKTDAVLEQDDSSEPSLLEMQTKTKAEIEQDDQDFEINFLGLTTKTFADTEPDD